MESFEELDPLDMRLLEALQRSARSTFAELGALVGLKPPAVHERVKRLEQRGYIRGYTARLDTKRLGGELVAFVSAYTTSDVEYERFHTAVSQLPEVTEIHSVAGDEAFVTQSSHALDRPSRRLPLAPQGGPGHRADAHDDRALDTRSSAAASPSRTTSPSRYARRAARDDRSQTLRARQPSRPRTGGRAAASRAQTRCDAIRARQRNSSATSRRSTSTPRRSGRSSMRTKAMPRASPRTCSHSSKSAENITIP